MKQGCRHKLRMLLTAFVVLSLPMSSTAYAKTSGDSGSRVIKKTIDIRMVKKTFPVPVYENLVGKVVDDVEYADEQLVFEDGYLKTEGSVRVRDAFTFNGKIPGPTIKAKAGDVLEITIRNLLPKEMDFPVIIHQHGIETDNESDGTPVSENGIFPGQELIHRFRVPRPGVFWYHPHIRTTNLIYSGMYAALIVKSEAEEILEKKGVLPKQVETIVLSDITVANEYNSTGNTFGFGGPGNPPLVSTDVVLYKPEEQGTIPAIQPDLARDDPEDTCQRNRHECIVREGELVLVNGKVPSKKTIKTIKIEEGGGVRLQIISASVERFYRLRLLKEGDTPPFGRQETYLGFDNAGLFGDCATDPLYCDTAIQPLYRVGGEGGLLDYVRLEGGISIRENDNIIYDSIIRKGEDMLAPADRTDVVIIARDKHGNYLKAGDVMYLWTVDFPHGRHVRPDGWDDLTEEERAKYNNGDGDLRNREIAARKLIKFVVVKKRGRRSHGQAFDIGNFDEGTSLRTHYYINDPTESLAGLPTNDLATVPVGELGLADHQIDLTNNAPGGFPSVDSVRGHYEGEDGIVGEAIPTQGATRYAHIGDVLELVYCNTTPSSMHPFHLHGFSFQPLSIHTCTQNGADGSLNLGQKLYDFDYNEFIDNVNMQPNQALVFRVKLFDRGIIPDTWDLKRKDIPPYNPYDLGIGGGVGRWLFHCHISHHAGLGMISDLCVAPEGEAAENCLIDIPDLSREIRRKRGRR